MAPVDAARDHGGPSRPDGTTAGLGAPGGAEATEDGGPRIARPWVWAITAVLAAQFAVLMVLVIHEYASFNLSVDFTIHNQAWFEIAHGHLDPTVSALGKPYWQDLGELLTWPMALSYWIFPNDGLTLLIATNLAVVGGEAMAMTWLVALARRRRLAPAMTGVCIVTALVLFVANPWTYRTVVQDFHFQTFAACFTLGAAYALWSGRRLRAWVFVGLALLTGVVAGTFIVGLGIAFAVTTRRCRRQAIMFAVAAVAWIVVLSALGARGPGFTGYGYLAGHEVGPGLGSVPAVVSGALTHPARPIDQLHAYRAPLFDDVAPTGFLGLFNPWMWGPLLVVLLTNGLDRTRAYVEPGFQNAPVYLFGITGTVLTGVLLIGWRRVRPAVVCGALVLAMVGALVFAADEVDRGGILPYSVTASAAAQLQRVRSATPGDAEVVSSFGVIGRFSGREYAYVMWGPGMTFPVNMSTVVFVLAPAAGNEPIPVQTMSATVHYVAAELHATPIVRGPDVWGYVWHPGPGVHQVTLPQ